MVERRLSAGLQHLPKAWNPEKLAEEQVQAHEALHKLEEEITLRVLPAYDSNGTQHADCAWQES